MSSTTASTTRPPFRSIPMSPNEDVLEVFESSLMASVQGIISQSSLQWTTLSLRHCGSDPRRLDLCPPTIVVTSSSANPPKQQVWQQVEAKVRREIREQTKMLIDVTIVQGTPFIYMDLGIPYPRPPPIGYSLGVAEEQLGKLDKGYSSTLGGFLVLPAMENLQVALTCNHVANPLDLAPKDAGLDELTPHVMRCPSNEDHAETTRKVAATFVLPSDQTQFNKNKKIVFKKLMDAICWEDLPERINDERIVFPAGTGRLIADDWDDFFQGNLGKDYVTAMAALPTAIELQEGRAAMEKCKLRENIEQLRACFDEIWDEEMANLSSATYRQARDADRQLGITKFASGLRVWPNSAATGPCVVDWALVETRGVHGVNGIPGVLRSLADAVCPGCPLAKGNPITSISPLKAGKTVFKIGRASGATVGVVNASKVHLSQDWLIQMGALPADGRLDGQAVAFTEEWNVSGVKYDSGQIVKEGLQFAHPGDSGAWVINANAELVGMVWCGMQNERHSYVQDVTMIWESTRMVTGLEVAFEK